MGEFWHYAPVGAREALCGLYLLGDEHVETTTQATHVTCPYCRDDLRRGGVPLPRPSLPHPRRGQLFKHPLGRMRVVNVTPHAVTFTYARDEDGDQYVRQLDRESFERTYPRRYG